jgi:sirohydrochlorin ferrochelatase
MTAVSGDANGSGSNDQWGVVFVAHGSQRGASPEECSCSWRMDGSQRPAWCLDCPSTPLGLRDAADRLQTSLGQQRAEVELSCLEFIEPHPDQSIQNLAEQGHEQVVVFPYLLGQGKHVTLEMDEILDDVRTKLPGLGLYLAGALGPDPRMAEIIVERVQSLGLPNLSGGTETGTMGVLVVKAGTKNQYDDCLWFRELGRIVENRLGLGYAVAVAQSHYGDPTVDDAATELVEERGVNSIIVVPYLFFPGLILKRNILGGMDRIAQAYPSVSLAVTPPLCVDDRLVAVAADRIRQVWDRVEN